MEKKFLIRLENLVFQTASQNCDLLLREITHYHLSKPGKMLRPLMVKILGDMYDVDEEDLLNWACCLELFHNASLIHDDLQDADEVRRGQQTVWRKYGMKQAVNAGDYLLMLANQPLLNIGDEAKRLQLQNIFTRTAVKIVQGQSLEFQLNAFEESLEPRKAYFQCVSLKTAALFSCLAEGVGVLANFPQSELKELSDLFHLIGIIFQLQDDILDLYGEKERDARGCDLKEGKVSFLVIKQLEMNTSEASGIKELLLKPRHTTTQEEVDFMSSHFMESGVLQAAVQELASFTKKARELPTVRTNQDLRMLIEGVLDKILEPIIHVDSSFTEETRA